MTSKDTSPLPNLKPSTRTLQVQQDLKKTDKKVKNKEFKSPPESHKNVKKEDSSSKRTEKLNEKMQLKTNGIGL